MTIDDIKIILKLYGASLSEDNFIIKNNKPTNVRIIIKSRRLRFESPTKRLIASGPINQSFVESFVEKFWFWKKLS